MSDDFYTGGLQTGGLQTGGLQTGGLQTGGLARIPALDADQTDEQLVKDAVDLVGRMMRIPAIRDGLNGEVGGALRSFEDIQPRFYQHGDIEIEVTDALTPSNAIFGPLTLTQGRPVYVPAADPPPSDPADSVRVWVTWGTANQQLASNWQDSFLFTASGYVYLEISLSTTGPLVVTGTEIKQAASVPSNPTWSAGSNRPSAIYYTLGYIFINGSTNSVQTQAGNLIVTEHVASISPSAGYGGGTVTKQLVCTREPY